MLSKGKPERAPISATPFPISATPFPVSATPFPFGGSAFPIGASAYPMGGTPFPLGSSPFPGSSNPWDPTMTSMVAPVWGTVTHRYPKATAATPETSMVKGAKSYEVSVSGPHGQKYPDQTYVDALKADGLYYPAKVISYDGKEKLYTIEWKNKDNNDVLKAESDLRYTEGFGSGPTAPGYRIATSEEAEQNQRSGYILKGFATSVVPAPGSKSGRFVYENGAWIATKHWTFGENVPTKPLPAPQYKTSYYPPAIEPYSIFGTLGFPTVGTWYGAPPSIY